MKRERKNWKGKESKDYLCRHTRAFGCAQESDALVIFCRAYCKINLKKQ